MVSMIPSPFLQRCLCPFTPPPTHTQLHLSNASELKGKKVLLVFRCPIGDYANAVVTFVPRKVRFLFFFVFFSWHFWRPAVFCVIIKCISHLKALVIAFLPPYNV